MATVLYVDDEDAIRRAVQLWLVRRGHVVHAAHDTDGAREVLATQELDGVFIDLWLGSASGLDLLPWIDELDPSLARRVAFVTGDPFDPALRNGSVQRRVFTKPFELRDLEQQAITWAQERSASLVRREPGGQEQPAPREDSARSY